MDVTVLCDNCPTMFETEWRADDPATFTAECPSCGVTADIDGMFTATPTPEEGIEEQTRALRSSRGGWWPKVRELLRERGVEPDRSALAEWFPDDTQDEFGVVVTRDGLVFAFDYCYFHRPLDQGWIANWRDLTTTWPDGPYHEAIARAAKFLAQEGC